MHSGLVLSDSFHFHGAPLGKEFSARKDADRCLMHGVAADMQGAPWRMERAKVVQASRDDEQSPFTGPTGRKWLRSF